MKSDNFEKEVMELLDNVDKSLKQKIEHPTKKGYGNISLPCFSFSNNPKEFSEDLVGKLNKLNESDLISDIKAIGPYVNFFVNEELFYKKLLNEIRTKKEKYGSLENKNKKIMIEFSQPNTHKGFHIGHLRGTSLGDSLRRILEFNGYDVIAVNYPGDIGAHVAKCLWCYLKFYKGKEPKQNKGKWLGEIYAEADKLLKENEDYKKEYEEILKKLYSGELNEEWKKTRDWSLKEFENIYKELDVSFKKCYFESEEEKRGEKYIEKAMKENIAEKSDGAIIFNLEKYGLGVLVALRSNKIPLYPYKDIPLAYHKFQDFDLDESIYVVAEEQNLYFQQLFKVLDLLGFKGKNNHVSFGLVKLKQGKMSSRKGNVILYEDLRDTAIEKVLEKMENKDKKIAKKIALGALKFTMLKRDPIKQVVFDWNEALNFEGNTGPYLQYSHARACSILENKEVKKINDFNFNEKEKQILSMMSEFRHVVKRSGQDYAPNIILQYLLDLSASFNDFYHSCRVIGSDNEDQRLLIVDSFRIVVSNGLKLLGIEPIEKM